MPKLSLWDYKKGDDYNFIDNSIREMIDISGVPVFVHKYLGPADQGATNTEIAQSGDLTLPNYEAETGSPATESDIQDLLLLEVRDRKYDSSIYELRGLYTTTDNDFNLTQFGIFLTSDTLFISFHINEMVERIGRKIMSGDVFEMPNMREDLYLDPTTPATNKYYVVQDANREADGFSPTWFPHIWRCKCTPITDSQEFSQIIGGPATDIQGNPITTGPDAGSTVGDGISNSNTNQEISDAIAAEAEREIPLRNYTTAHLYVFCKQDTAEFPPYIEYGDGIPDGAEPVTKATNFPEDAPEGTFILRTDYEPYVLFQKQGPIWRRMEADWRKNWSAANRVLEQFINNRKTQQAADGSTYNEKQYLNSVLKPKVDYGGGNYPKLPPLHPDSK